MDKSSLTKNITSRAKLCSPSMGWCLRTLLQSNTSGVLFKPLPIDIIYWASGSIYNKAMSWKGLAVEEQSVGLFVDDVIIYL